MLVDLWVDQTRITRESTCNCYRQYGRFYPRILGSFTRLSAWTCPTNDLGSQSSSSSILQRTAISTTSRLGPSISLIRQRMAESTFEFWKYRHSNVFVLVLIISLTNTNFICHMQRSFTGSLLGTAIYRFLGPDRIVLQPKFTASSIWWDLTLFLGLTG